MNLEAAELLERVRERAEAARLRKQPPRPLPAEEAEPRACLQAALELLGAQERARAYEAAPHLAFWLEGCAAGEARLLESALAPGASGVSSGVLRLALPQSGLQLLAERIAASAAQPAAGQPGASRAAGRRRRRGRQAKSAGEKITLPPLTIAVVPPREC